MTHEQILIDALKNLLSMPMNDVTGETLGDMDYYDEVAEAKKVVAQYSQHSGQQPVKTKEEIFTDKVAHWFKGGLGIGSTDIAEDILQAMEEYASQFRQQLK